MNEITQRIKSLRKEKQLTQAAVAKMLNMKLSKYSQMERQGRISADIAIKLAWILHVSPERIIPPIEIGGSITEPPLPKSMELKLTRTKVNLIKVFRSLTSHDKKEILDFSLQKYLEYDHS